MEEFSYTVSHDLRAPLRGMQAYSEALLQDFAGVLPPPAQHYLERIAANAERLDKMILDVLTFSRWPSVEVELQPVNLDRLLRPHCRAISRDATSSSANQTWNRCSRFWATNSPLTQPSNVLDNAVKFVAPNVPA